MTLKIEVEYALGTIVYLTTDFEYEEAFSIVGYVIRDKDVVLYLIWNINQGEVEVRGYEIKMRSLI